jgi:hypothetical protein
MQYWIKNLPARKLKIGISFVFLIFVNFIFYYKYGIRVSPATVYFIPFFLVYYLLLFLFFFQLRFSSKVFRFFLYLLTGFLVIGSVFIFKKVNVYSLHVDRWSVISSFWNSYFNHRYVYYARSFMHSYPGPMPFYFILALPAYLIGEIGILTLVAFIVFLLLLGYSGIDEKWILFAGIFLVSSPFFIWELVTRSTNFFNTVLILFYLVWWQKSDHGNTRYFIISAFAGGLLLSTRSVFILPYAIFMLYELKSRRMTIKKLIITGIIMLVAIIISFLPFVINHLHDFLAMNPFLIESSFLPFAYTICFILFSISVGLFCRNFLDVIFSCAIVLFITILIYSFYNIEKYGLHTAYLRSKIDISYFIFSAPFLIYYLIYSISLEIKEVS